MWFIGAEVEKETSAPPPKDNPGSAPAINQSINQSINHSIKINQQKLLSKQSSTKFESRPFSDNLTAYRKRNSCETALVSLTENWKKARS